MARILVIDDNASVLELLRLALTEEGHDVCAMPDGPSGIASAQENPPEMAILDFRMPDMNGVEVLRALKRLQPRLLVFFHTVYGDFEGKLELDEADCCFVKSSDLSPLIQAIARVVASETRNPRAWAAASMSDEPFPAAQETKPADPSTAGK